MTDNILIAEDIALYDLENSFHLQFSEDSGFFPEWQADCPEITTEEKTLLNLAKAGYFETYQTIVIE